MSSNPRRTWTIPIRSIFVFKGEMKAHLAEAISKLSEREQLILSLYYREELTMKEISEVVGVALSRISQIRQASMKKLRVSLAHLRERPVIANAAARTIP